MIAFVEDRLPAEPLAVPLARHSLAMALLTDVPDAVLDTVLLLANEAVSTALRATTRPWHLRVDLDDDQVQVMVRYEGAAGGDSSLDLLRDALLDELSAAWGIEVSADGETTTIWFDIELAPEASPAPPT
ncbi:MAG: hypothetical protein JWO68_2023 [Actinomycetia bacterium]|nr:hypothetical protein [Actinomycetes bacterium]